MARKLSHWRVKFEHPGRGMDACKDCVFWIGYQEGHDSCRIVRAPVRRDDWCNRFRYRLRRP
jgi:hypothetical protein